MKKKANKKLDIVIIGGLGHVGLPLGISFANKGLQVCLLDVDPKKAKEVKKGNMPFIEYDAEPILKKVLQNGSLQISLDLSIIARAQHVIIALGTPIDEYLNPKTRQFLSIIEKFKPYLNEEQTIIVRSTIYPRTCLQMYKALGKNKNWKIAYCPERIVQGYAIRELVELPQIVSGMTRDAYQSAEKLFAHLSPKIIRTSIGEAELIKLFSNAWRYIQFAATNQFYMIAQNFGVDYEEVRRAMTDGYGRAATLPSAGFAAGPCLLKDTMQLSAFCGNEFVLGHAAMMINEGLPNFIVRNLSQKYDLGKTRIGILGMAFKADIDDVRDSLSFKLGKILRFHGAQVYYSDEFAQNPDFVSKEKLIASSDVVIVAVPHTAYKGMKIPPLVDVIDLWNITIHQNTDEMKSSLSSLKKKTTKVPSAKATRK